MLPPIGLVRKTGRVGSVEWTEERPLLVRILVSRIVYAELPYLQ